MTQKHEWLALPVSVAIAGAFIGIGIYFGAGTIARGGAPRAAAPSEAPAANAPANQAAIKVSPATPLDHIRGSIGAKAVIIEYSDLECPFCKQFHATVKNTVAKFSKGEVAWIYRHFPLDAIHSKARKEAEATECAAELGGNDAFWRYTDRLFEITPANNGLDLAELPRIAEYVGLDKKKFETCLSSGKYAAKVEAQYKSGVEAGVKGTPFSIIVSSKGTTPINGAVPAAELERQLREILGK